MLPNREVETVQNLDHIRKELSRLAKMARLMQLRELAHFIDVAGEVATEVQSLAAKAGTAKHA